MSAPPVEFAVANAMKTFSQFKVTDKERTEKPPNVTNLNFEKLKIGKFHVKKDDYDTFLAHIANYVFDERVPLGLVERPLTEVNDGTRLSPLRVDLDFRFPTNERFMEDGIPKRIIGSKIALDFVSLLWDELCKIADFEDFEPEDVIVYAMQKPTPEHDESKGVIKDGLHIFCKTIQMVPELHLFLRKRVLARLTEVIPPECFEITGKGDIYDETVLYKGGWMIHGNRKSGKHSYGILFRAHYTPQDPTRRPKIVKTRISRDTNKQLVKTLSIRYGIEGTYAIGIQDDAHEEFQDFVNRNAKAKQSLLLNSVKNHRDPISITQSRVISSQIESFSLDSEVALDKTNDLKSAAWLVSMLSKQRSSSYDTWVNVGICLRNMSRIEGLPDVRTGSMVEKMPDGHEIITDNGMYNLWVEFSRKSDKYVEGIEEKDDWYNKFWLKFGSRSNLDTMIKRPTLRLWAKNDNGTRYQAFLDADIYTEIARVVRSGGTHVDMANLARIMYGDEFICANIKNSVWYQFLNSSHRFVRSDSATTLRRNLSHHVRLKFQEYRRKIEGEIARANADNPENMIDVSKDERVKSCHAIFRSLGQTKFLNDTITECKHRFYETFGEDFIRKLDTNKNLICFNNGVYDLEHCTFRDGRPEDMISMTVGYDYMEYDDEDPKTVLIEEMFKKIFTNKDVREYMWGIMASVLCGENWRQEIYFMNGVGANGKSVLANWMLKAMGDYAIKPSVSLITDKRSNAQSASPETYSLKNKRFVYMEEPDEGDGVKINHALLKDWSGGGTLRGRPLYGELETFGIMFKLFFSCNEFPRISTEEAMWRRLKVIQFKSKFLKPGTPIHKPETQFIRDERLVSDDFIEDHVSQFMSILIEVYRKQWKNRALPFVEPDSIQEYSREKRKESEMIHSIFETMFVPIDAGELSARFIGNDDLVKKELMTEKEMYDEIKRNPDFRSGKNGTREIRKSILTYLETINAREIPIVHNGITKIYYPFRLLTES
jgi:P4 family phage/plasmid primase-like protien